jgi:hypothetical protein
MQAQTQKKSYVGWFIALAVFLLFIALAVVSAISYFNAYDLGNRTETELQAVQRNNKNIYAQGTQAIMEIAKVPKMYAKNLQDIVTAEIQGKYGKDGSQATMQWLQDRQITLPETSYNEITQQIKAFRAKYEVNQTRLIDIDARWGYNLNSLWTGFWLKMAGYPKLDREQFKPITTDLTEEVYQRGTEKGPLQIE